MFMFGRGFKRNQDTSKRIYRKQDGNPERTFFLLDLLQKSKKGKKAKKKDMSKRGYMNKEVGYMSVHLHISLLSLSLVILACK